MAKSIRKNIISSLNQGHIVFHLEVLGKQLVQGIIALKINKDASKQNMKEKKKNNADLLMQGTIFSFTGSPQ